jgi:hypothetical protein
MNDERPPIGFQDRIAQSLSAENGRQPARTSTRQRTTQDRNQQVVGSGLIRSTSSNQARASTAQAPEPSVTYPQPNPSNRVQQHSFNAQSHTPLPIGNSVVEYNAVSAPGIPASMPSRFDVQKTSMQDGDMQAVPVRHAFVQDFQPRDHFDQEFEWVEDHTPQTGFQPRHRSSAPPSAPRQTSVLRRQEDPSALDFQPQPTANRTIPRGDLMEEIEILDHNFERRQPIQDETPRSLLDLDERFSNQSNDQDTKSTLLDRTCEEFRRDLMSTPIRDIALDLSPPAINMDKSATPLSRNWSDRSGRVIASGTMVDMRRGYVILNNGQKIAFARLSEVDLVAVSEYWNIPRSCLFSQPGTVVRLWHPQTYTWTASSLCHKPLYFENIQLERYGHSHGPVMQPIRSAAHFFISLAFLPYQTAIHPANECQYPLGLYRPGACAPWLKDPIPISLDGVRRQALVTTGAAFIIP